MNRNWAMAYGHRSVTLADVRTTASPRIRATPAPSTSTRAGPSSTRPITRHPAGTGAGERCDQGMVLSPAEHPRPRVDPRLRRTRQCVAVGAQRFGAQSRCPRRTPRPGAAGRRSDHRRCRSSPELRPRRRRAPARTAVAGRVATPQLVESSMPLCHSAYPAAECPSWPVTATASRVAPRPRHRRAAGQVAQHGHRHHPLRAAHQVSPDDPGADPSASSHIPSASALTCAAGVFAGDQILRGHAKAARGHLLDLESA